MWECCRDSRDRVAKAHRVSKFQTLAQPMYSAADMLSMQRMDEMMQPEARKARVATKRRTN
jgi:hypothetical protein